VLFEEARRQIWFRQPENVGQTPSRPWLTSLSRRSLTGRRFVGFQKSKGSPWDWALGKKLHVFPISGRARRGAGGLALLRARVEHLHFFHDRAAGASRAFSFFQRA